MRKEVIITQEESNNVYRLFSTYTSYMNVLRYFMENNMADNSIYDKKWNEAVEIDIKLTEAKKAVEKKYKPAGDWDRFEFDFDRHMVVFTKNET